MNVLKPLIDQLVKVIQAGGDVITGQMPDIANQLVRLYLWGNVIEIPILLGLLYGSYRLAVKCYETQKDTDDPWMVGWIPIGIFQILVGIYVYACGQTLLKAILAPKVLIIECLREYLK